MDRSPPDGRRDHRPRSGYLGTRSPSRTWDFLLAGAQGYTADYWQTLVRDYSIPAGLAQYLARKYGTAAPEVLELTRSDRSLGAPLVTGEAPIRAQVVYAARVEMAIRIEDVLARRIGLQLYSWRAAIEAAPIVAELLRRELGWSGEEEGHALEAYIAAVNHMISMAGQSPEPAPLSAKELVLERK